MLHEPVAEPLLRAKQSAAFLSASLRGQGKSDISADPRRHLSAAAGDALHSAFPLAAGCPSTTLTTHLPTSLPDNSHAPPAKQVDLTRYVERHMFSFDDALDAAVSNDAVYRSTVQPLVATIFKAGKATCFAYGQTGAAHQELACLCLLRPECVRRCPSRLTVSASHAHTCA